MAGSVTYATEVLPQLSGAALNHAAATVSGTGIGTLDNANALAIVLLDANSPSLKITPAQSVAQASTTSGQAGDLVMGAVTTAAPAYTTAQTNPLSLTTAGSLRTDLASINGTTTPVGLGGVSQSIRVAAIIQDGTHAAAVLSGTNSALYVAPTDGTNTMPMGDSTARPIFHKITDGTNVAAVGTGTTKALLASIHDGTTLAAVIAATSALKVDLSSIAGTATPVGLGAVSNSIRVAAIIQDGANAGSINTTGAANALNVAQQATTTGGASFNSQTALTNSVVAVKASAGQLYGWFIENPNASVVFVQVFDATAPTLGTTTPSYVIGVPASGVAAMPLGNVGIAHANAIKVAATTTATGSTAPGTALTAAFFYK